MTPLPRPTTLVDPGQDCIALTDRQTRPCVSSYLPSATRLVERGASETRAYPID